MPRHLKTGWTRETVEGTCGGQTRITPTDDSGERIVALLYAGEWQNLPQDSEARKNHDRVVIIEGASLPDWTTRWLHSVMAKQKAHSEAAFEASQFDADMNEFYGRGEW